jgi:predicted nuclease with RNAse H fold
MRTAGIDFAAQPKNTALCVIEWAGGRAKVVECRLNVTDEEMEQAAGGTEKVGIDAPIGWPERFVAAVSSYHRRGGWPANVASVDVRFRRTDMYVRRATGRWPLSVSSDLIACTAFRAAALLSRMERQFGPTDRTGAGKFVEVYPRAARNRWRISSFETLLAAAGDWLRIEPAAARLCRDSGHCFDAVVACLATRAAAAGLCDPIPEEDREAAAVEGWIALPEEGSLAKLFNARSAKGAK